MRLPLLSIQHNHLNTIYTHTTLLNTISHQNPLHSLSIPNTLLPHSSNKQFTISTTCFQVMEKETTEVFLQWGNKKRLRCVRVRGSSSSDIFDPSKRTNGNTHPDHTSSRVRRKTFYSLKDPLFPHLSTRLPRNGETTSHRSENGKSTSTSPERHYTTRGSMVGLDEIGKCSLDATTVNHHVGDAIANNNISNKISNSDSSGRGFVWPKIYITLSSKEKEEDFMAMKGCKLPQRPKKRAKIIQRTLLLVSPGAWLSDMSVERYEVREKKSSKKKARGLKAMGGIESDSE